MCVCVCVCGGGGSGGGMKGEMEREREKGGGRVEEGKCALGAKDVVTKSNRRHCHERGLLV